MEQWPNARQTLIRTEENKKHAQGFFETCSPPFLERRYVVVRYARINMFESEVVDE